MAKRSKITKIQARSLVGNFGFDGNPRKLGNKQSDGLRTRGREGDLALWEFGPGPRVGLLINPHHLGLWALPK